LVVALLQLVLFQARADEHAILLVLGHRPRRLVARAVRQCAAVAAASWLCGIGLALVVLSLYARFGLTPRGLAMRVFDAQPILASLWVPIVAVVVAAVVLARQLHRMDPVEVVARRGV
jgi:ABC-type antimicrobial peptide transport system permease subunit